MTPRALKTGPWKLSDLEQPELDAPTVFSCFHCGGGSTMGYKLAGYRVLGGVEIDPEMMSLYRANHNPKHSYLMGVEQFNKIPLDSLPDELRNLDILDGSPPCSSFSIAGSREDKWGESHKFREGQAEQILDDLFFHFIEIANRLRPKVVIAENVKGLVIGNARGYVKQIFDKFRAAGYTAQLFLLNSARMGVPQRRERVFFTAIRSDIPAHKLILDFNERETTVKDAFDGVTDRHTAKTLEPFLRNRGAREWCAIHNEYRIEQWRLAVHGKKGYFNHVLVLPNRTAPTQTASVRHIHWAEDRRLSDMECVRLQSFPDDFNFVGNDAGYVCGMSVPPFMMQRLADQVLRQWLLPARS